jgi:UDP-N-acetylmuramoyl-tripeptide--D-alanyl-D-alanine ligase
MNACAAFAVGEICGVESSAAARALALANPMPGRGRVYERGGALLVDESYNASPASMVLSLSMLAGIDGVGRRIAVLGDMKELGDATRDSHERIGRHAATLGLDAVWWVGAEAVHVERGLSGATAFESFRGVDAAIAALCGRITAGDAVLVKASRACELDRFVREMIRRLDEEAEG